MQIPAARRASRTPITRNPSLPSSSTGTHVAGLTRYMPPASG